MLKVEFKQVENVVLMKVLEQGKEIELGHGVFFKHNDIKLISSGYPSIYPDTLCVKGTANFNQDNYASHSFNTSEEAEEYIAKFTEVINAYNESVKENDLLWKPEEGEKYYYVSNNHEYISKVTYDSFEFHKDYVKNFTAFKTNEQAEKVRKHSVLMNLLWQLKFALCPNCEFELDSTYNSFIRFNRASENFECDLMHRAYDFVTPVFNRESCLKAVEYLNNHRELWEDLV